MLYLKLYGDIYYAVYGNIFALELFVSLLFLVAFQPRRQHFALRAYICFICYFVFENIIWFLIVKLANKTEWVNGLFFFLCVVALAVGIYRSFKINFLGAISFATGAYAVQHAAYSLGNFVRYLFSISLPFWAQFVVFDVLAFCVVGAIFFFAFVFPRRNEFEFSTFDVRAFVISSLTLIVCVVLSLVVDNIFAGFLEEKIDLNGLRVCCSTYAFLSCVAAVAIQFSFMHENKLTGENAMLDQLIYTEHKRYEMSKETIEIINEKCHDLKHQIAFLSKIDDSDARKSYISELESYITFYDTSAATGNAALDIIISEKCLICEKNNISFSYLVDGEKLAFMNSADIVALFGNALDNAIEKQFAESEDKRFISLSVKEKNGYIYVHIDNRCSVSPEFIDGIPQTTKQDKSHHGFGTKSISSIAAKYKGEVYMSVDDERFNLDILFAKHALPITR